MPPRFQSSPSGLLFSWPRVSPTLAPRRAFRGPVGVSPANARGPRRGKRGPRFESASGDKKSAASRFGSGVGRASAREAAVAEQQPADIDEISNRGYVPAGVHDGEFGLCQHVDGSEHIRVSQIARFPDQLSEIALNEKRCVAVFRFSAVAGQPDDAVVCDASPAGQIKDFHVLQPI